jgi:hypothetical protein
MSKPARKFLAYTATGRAFGVYQTKLSLAVRDAEAAKEKGEEILAVVDASCVPEPATEETETRPFFALLLWNRAYKPPELPE